MNPLYDFEDMEDYLHDRMTKSDRLAFEQALETDAGMAKRLEALRAEVKVLRLLRDQFVLEQFDEWENEAKGNKPAFSFLKPVYRRWFLPVAAAIFAGFIATGIALGWFSAAYDKTEIVKTGNELKPDTVGKPVQTPQNQAPIVPENPVQPPRNSPPEPETQQYAALAQSTYIDEDFNQTLMGAGQENEPANRYVKAIRLYGAGQYDAALTLLLQPDSTQLQESLYLRAYTYYHLKQYAKAAQDFRAFRNFSVSDRKIDAIWGEIFCLTKLLPASRKQLDALLKEITAQPQHPYYQRAVALQQALNRQ